MTARTTRRGFTLIELLVVIGIIIILASLAAAFLPNLDRNKGVPNAATQVQGWLNLAKQQAMRDGAPRGLRIIHDGNGQATSIQYIEQPLPVAPRGPGIRVAVHTELAYDPILFPAFPGNIGPLSVATLFQDVGNAIPPGIHPSQFENAWIAWDGIQPGDYFELSEGPFSVARILRFSTPAVNGGIAPPSGAVAGGNPYAQFVLDRVIEGTENGTSVIHQSAGFRVLRAPRPLVGEPMLQLHRDVVIDLTACYPSPIGLLPSDARFAPYSPKISWSPNQIPPALALPGDLNYADILFNSSGVVGNAPTGQIVLTIRHVDRPNDMVLLTVYTRTGKITAHVIYDVPGADPFSFTRDGRGSGL